MITVSAVQCGWSVASEGVETLMFQTGARAEAAARGLAERFARLGRSNGLRIVLGDGSLAAAFVCEPSLAGPKWRRTG